MRQIVLDTETTGLEPAEGHRIIEIGCVEIVNRRLTGDDRRWYLNPDRDIDEGAVEVHGITSDFLADKPRFRDIADEFLEYIRGAELVIHNAPFDVGFLNHELEVHLGRSERVDVICGVLDTLQMARRMYPGQRASLDALCKRFEIDNSRREYHGALLDAQLLAEVYLAMTGGQAALLLDAAKQPGAAAARAEQRIAREGLVLPVIAPKESEALLHARFLDAMREQGATPLWQELEPSEV